MTAELYHLLEAGEYQSCLEQGRRLLEAGPLDGMERAQIMAVLCRCYLELEDLPAAVAVGKSAVAEAQQAQLGDLEGSALLDLAMAQARQRRYEAALTSLDRFRQNLDRYTASALLEGAALHLTGQVLCQLGRPEEAAAWFRSALQWYDHRGETSLAAEALLCSLEAHLAAGDPLGAQQQLEAVTLRMTTDAQLGRLCLARARLFRMTGRLQESVAEAFQALQVAEPLSPLQVEAHLYLSRTAAETDRQVEALSFALAARVAAIDGRLYQLEFEAGNQFARLVRRFGLGPVNELTLELERQGVDLYQYVDPGSLTQLLQEE